jgi:hypothetical protein
LKSVDRIPLRRKFRSQFAFPFDTSLPLAVHQVLKSVQTSRPSAQECVDAVTYFPNDSGKKRYEVLLEAKSTIDEEYLRSRIRAALQRQDSNARVSFIVVDKHPRKGLQFDISDIRVLDRSRRVNRRFAKGSLLNARVFLVNIDASRKVFLDPIDGQPRNEAAESVIFVISLSMINQSYQD